MFSILLIVVILIDSCNHIYSLIHTSDMLTIKRTINNIITSATTTYYSKTINLFSKHQQLLNLINDNYHDMSISTSVSPLYTTNDETIISNHISSCSSSSSSKVMTNSYTIRFVEMKDIDQVDQCNRNNLPENYNVSCCTIFIYISILYPYLSITRPNYI
jgi:hypothetical protein